MVANSQCVQFYGSTFIQPANKWAGTIDGQPGGVLAGTIRGSWVQAAGGIGVYVGYGVAADTLLEYYTTTSTTALHIVNVEDGLLILLNDDLSLRFNFDLRTRRFAEAPTPTPEDDSRPYLWASP